MGFAALAGVVAVLIGQAAPVPFTTQHTAAAARNAVSPRFTVSIAGGRRTFRIGERISLVLTYDDVPSRRDPDDGRCARLIIPVVDRPAGTGDPRRDLYRTGMVVPGGICGCAEGGVVGPSMVIAGVEYDANGVPSFLFKQAPAPPKPKLPAVKVPYELSDHLRFDLPGRYRLYMADDITEGTGVPLISNIIELEIAARDAAWEDETLRRVVRVLDTPASVEQRGDALRTLELLPSRKAIDEMARQGAISGLFGARDRSEAIAAVTRQVDNPSRAVSDHDLMVLAGLHATRSAGGVLPGGIFHQRLMQAHSRRLRALAAAGVLVERLIETWSTANENEGGPAPRSVSYVAVTPALAGFTKPLESALSRLPVAEREATLSRHALTFTDDRRFLPLLRRLARQGSPAADGLLAEFASSELPASPVRFFAPDTREIYAEWDEEARRRTYRIGGTAVYFDALSVALGQFPAGTTFNWVDQLEYQRTLDREGEFRRLERVLRRAGMSLTRR